MWNLLTVHYEKIPLLRPMVFRGDYPITLNTYLYVEGNPLSYVDPWGLISESEVANIIFNETRSFTGSGIASARYDIAQAIFNGAAALGANRPRTAPATPPRGGIPRSEVGTYQQCLNAAMKADNDRVMGIDPTRGSIYFNFRGNASMAPRYGLPVQTHVGPLNNSFPTSLLPATGNFANTYGSGK